MYKLSPSQTEKNTTTKLHLSRTLACLCIMASQTLETPLTSQQYGIARFKRVFNWALKPFKHHSRTVLQGLVGALNCAPLCRVTSLSDNRYNFFQSVNTLNNLFTTMQTSPWYLINLNPSKLYQKKSSFSWYLERRQFEKRVITSLNVLMLMKNLILTVYYLFSVKNYLQCVILVHGFASLLFYFFIS